MWSSWRTLWHCMIKHSTWWLSQIAIAVNCMSESRPCPPFLSKHFDSASIWELAQNNLRDLHSHVSNIKSVNCWWWGNTWIIHDCSILYINPLVSHPLHCMGTRNFNEIVPVICKGWNTRGVMQSIPQYHWQTGAWTPTVYRGGGEHVR